MLTRGIVLAPLLALAVTTMPAAASTATTTATGELPPREAPWQFRAAAGAQLDSSSHGVVDLGARKGPLSLQLLTDTVELRFEPEDRGGRWWLAVRGEAGAAGLFPSPWRAGSPDDARSLLAFYAGLEGGALAYLPHGLYLGVEGTARRWFFRATDSTQGSVPEDRFVISPSMLAGWWSKPFHVWIRAGADVDGGDTSGRLTMELTLFPWARHRRATPRPWLTPLVEVHAGWLDDPSDVTRERIGGLNPYVVPLAGAGWAELWAERWAAIRAGPALELGPLRLALVADGVRYEGGKAYGLALLSRVTFGALYGEASLGFAPELERGPGVSRFSGWLLAGFDWTAL